jgi:hypothetical protein
VLLRLEFGGTRTLFHRGASLDDHPLQIYSYRRQSKKSGGNFRATFKHLTLDPEAFTIMDRKYLSSLHAQYGTPRASDPSKSSSTSINIPIVVPPSPFDPAATATPTTIATMPSVMKDLNNASAPSPITIAVAIGLLGLLAGYFVGQGRSIGLFGGSSGSSSGGRRRKDKGKGKAKKSWPNSYDVKIHEDSSSEDVAGVGTGETESEEEEEEDLEDSENSQEVKAFEGSREEVKLVLCLRTDLGMTKGTSVSFFSSRGGGAVMHRILLIYWC